MNPPNNKDHHFSSFAIGLSLGVIGALLLSTEEGRKIVKKVIGSLPEKCPPVPDLSVSAPLLPSLETPHHTTYVPEAPPPPPPSVRLTRPSNTL